MRLSFSKAGAHDGLDQNATEDAKLAKFGYDQGLSAIVPFRQSVSDQSRAQKVLRFAGNDRLRL
jgi:hypothetical protein